MRLHFTHIIICFSIRLVFHQHLNSYIAYPGSPTRTFKQHKGNFFTCHRSLFSEYFDQSLTTMFPERGFSTCVTLALHLVQPHRDSITTHVDSGRPHMTSHKQYVILLSDFDQSNLRRGYDVKYRNCPRVWFEGLGGLPGSAMCDFRC